MLSDTLRKSIVASIERANRSLNLIGALLSSLDYRKVLQRGFAIVRSDNADLVTSIKHVRKAQKLSIEMQDGVIEVYSK